MHNKIVPAELLPLIENIHYHLTNLQNHITTNMLDVVRSGVTNLFAIAGHFVSYRWVSGPHNFLVILWNLLKTKKNGHQQKQTTNES